VFVQQYSVSITNSHVFFLFCIGFFRIDMKMRSLSLALPMFCMGVAIGERDFDMPHFEADRSSAVPVLEDRRQAECRNDTYIRE